jgi:polysaccharide export outer membrane protein
MTKLMRFLVFLMLPALVAGCSGRGGPIAYNPTSFGPPDAEPLPIAALDYRLAPGDVVTVQVFNVQNLSGDRTLDARGRVDIPLLGLVDAAGRTTDELARTVRDGLGAKYLNSPTVSVTIKTVQLKTLTVDGSVSQPGVYPVAGNMTLLQAIANARGTAQGANPKRVAIFRQIDGRRQAAAFDLTTIRRGVDQDPRVYPDDVIVVDGSTTNAAWRQILQTLPVVALFQRF